MKRPARLALAVAALLATASVQPGPSVASSAKAYEQIEGSGSTWSAVIVDQWIADVDSAGMKVTYNGGGSSQGRKNFAQNVTDFGISEIPYQGKDEQGQADTSNGRDFAYLPIVAGGTAFTYQIKVGNKRVDNLRLSGETIAKIFTNQITNWNDPQITKDNNGRKLPNLPITPVIRSDGSGTTAQFTTWLDKEYPSIWRKFYPRGGLTSYYPKGGRMVAQSGSDQVMNTVAGFAGNGTIGYVEYSFPINKGFPVVKVLNKGGFFVEPTQYNVAVALTKAKINQDKGSIDYLTQVLDGVYRSTDPRAYPLSSYSYMIIPTGKDDRRMKGTRKRQTIADFMFYSLCEGQANAGKYGYSPLPLNLVQAGFQQLGKLKQADPSVDLDNKDVTKCHNPTFVAGNLKRNKLAEVAPAPAACDKVGAGPCVTGTGKNQPSTDDTSAKTDEQGSGPGSNAGAGGPGSGASGPDTATAGPGAADPAAGGDPTQVDPETGLPISAADGSGAADVYANPTELSADRAADRTAFGWLVAAELVALVLVPGIFAAFLRRRRTGGVA